MCVCFFGGGEENEPGKGLEMKVGGKDVLLIGRRTKVGLAHEQKPMSSGSLSPDSQ